MNVRIYRSAEYLKARTIETGSNAPDWIDVDVDPTRLSIDARTDIVEWYGKFPMKVDALYYAVAGGGNRAVTIATDVEAADVTADLASDLLIEVIAEAKRGAAQYLDDTAEARAKEEADRAALEARHDAEITAFLADPGYRPASGFHDPGNGILLTLADGRIDHRHPRWGELVAEYRARWAAYVQAENVAKADEAKRLRAQLDDWVAKNGTEGQRKRMARGLLSDDEIIASIKEQVFAPLDHLPRYVPMKDYEVKDHYAAVLDGYFRDMTVLFDTEHAKSATDDQLSMIEEIEAMLPGCEATLLVNTGFLEETTSAQDDEANLVRKSIRVVIRVGELTLSRSYES